MQYTIFRWLYWTQIQSRQVQSRVTPRHTWCHASVLFRTCVNLDGHIGTW
jgi:hypothetical protein